NRLRGGPVHFARWTPTGDTKHGPPRAARATHHLAGIVRTKPQAVQLAKHFVKCSAALGWPWARPAAYGRAALRPPQGTQGRPLPQGHEPYPIFSHRGARLAPRLRLLLLAQLEALDLAGLGVRQVGDELDRARVLVRRDLGLDEILQLLRGLRRRL